jgi:rhodanese-related sulfurtransferase
MAVRKWLLVLLVFMLAASMTVLSGCGGEQVETPTETTEPTEEAATIDEAAALIKVTNDYVSSEFSKTWLINAVDLQEKLFVENDESFQLIDLRSPEHYANGHIEGALNIPLETIVEESALTQIDPAKTVVLIDYDGSAATGIHLFLTQLDYDVLTLRFGMSGWTTDPAISSPDGSPVWDGKGKDYPLSTDPVTAEGSFEIPQPSTGAKDTTEAIINGAKAYLAAGGPTVIDADEVKTIVDAKDPNYQILSVMAPEDYPNGHIEGSLFFPRGNMATEEALKQLDPDKKIIVVCYQGHNAGMVQMFLKQLGYDAVSLHYALGAWTNDRAAFGEVKTYDPANVKNFPTVK